MRQVYRLKGSWTPGLKRHAIVQQFPSAIGSILSAHRFGPSVRLVLDPRDEPGYISTRKTEETLSSETQISREVSGRLGVRMMLFF